MAEPAEEAEERAVGVAGRLTDLLTHLYGELPEITVTGWDGSRSSGPDDLVVHVRSRKSVRRLLWSPGELGVAQAYVAGDLDVEGDLARAVSVLRDYEAFTVTRGPLGGAGRREVLRTTVLLGAVGPAPRAPDEALDAVRGYAAVDRQITDQLPDELARLVLGDGAVPSPADPDSPSRRVEVVADLPKPLSAQVLAWERAGVVLEEIVDITKEHGQTLEKWSTSLREQRAGVVDAVGETRTRVWELSLVLDRDSLARGKARIYRMVGSAD